MKVVALLAVLATLPLQARQSAQQQTSFGEHVDVRAVLVDAVVTDSKGRQILGLGKDDFVITENGVSQTVDSLDYFTNRRLLTDREQNAPFKVEQIKEERYFVFFFDKPSDGKLFDQLSMARRAAREFVDHQMLPTDRVAVVTQDVRLKVLSDFSADHKQLDKALDDAAFGGRGLMPSDATHDGVSLLSNVDKDHLVNATGTVYEALETLADMLRPIPARKQVILFSPGIHEPGETVSRGILLNTSRYYEPMIHALNRANVTVYPINLQRDADDVPVVHQTLQRIALETNGEYYRYLASYTPIVKKIVDASNGYYLLTYTPSKSQSGKGYQHIDVKLKNPEFRVKARDGYSYGE